ncbi:glycosyltransferase family 2 protein [Acinetobacter sp. MB5]|uniref:glycosyltransferase family 2 protein n=1 Tax=Acinetobacter sp. MB5 TaxID=2069438 RepID=UPI000DCFD997|nr:glycosyltransferase family 2 protein [Acinetobacter sp. MB5]
MKLSCIIPAYNEAPRIGKVLDAVCGHAFVHEIIVVDDQSTDNTVEAAQRSGVKVICLDQNGGKSNAVAAGISAASGSHVLLLDADLIGLTALDITTLVEPIWSGLADVSLSLRGNSPWPWQVIGLDYISGERVFRRDQVVKYLDEIGTLPRFGLEVWLNHLWLADNSRIKVVRWPDVMSPYKAKKMGWSQGVIADIQMLRDIFNTVPLRKATMQIMKMWAKQNKVKKILQSNHG